MPRQAAFKEADVQFGLFTQQAADALALYQEFFREHGAAVSLMSGSGSTTFAIFQNQATAEAATEPFKSKFGSASWISVVPL